MAFMLIETDKRQSVACNDQIKPILRKNVRLDWLDKLHTNTDRCCAQA